jgi:hypothetical protein
MGAYVVRTIRRYPIWSAAGLSATLVATGWFIHSPSILLASALPLYLGFQAGPEDADHVPRLERKMYRGRDIWILSGAHADSTLSAFVHDYLQPQIGNPERWLFLVEGGEALVDAGEVERLQAVADQHNIPLHDPVIYGTASHLRAVTDQYPEHKAKLYALLPLARVGVVQRGNGQDAIKTVFEEYSSRWKVGLEVLNRGLQELFSIAQKNMPQFEDEMGVLREWLRAWANPVSARAVDYWLDRYPDKSSILLYVGGAHRSIVGLEPDFQLSDGEIERHLQERTSELEKYIRKTSRQKPSHSSEAEAAAFSDLDLYLTRAEEASEREVARMVKDWSASFRPGLSNSTSAWARDSILLGWAMMFDRQGTVYRLFQKYRDQIKPLLPSAIGRHLSFESSTWFSDQNEWNHFQLYAILKALRVEKEIFEGETTVLSDFVVQYRRYKDDGEAFRRAAIGDWISKGDESTLLRYLYLRNHVFGGVEFGTVPNGARITNLGKPHDAQAGSHWAIDELVEYDLRTPDGQMPRYRFYLYRRYWLDFRSSFGYDRYQEASFERPAQKVTSPEKGFLTPFYDAVTQFASIPVGPGKGMSFRTAPLFTYALSELDKTYAPYADEKNDWHLDAQLKIHQRVDHLYKYGHLADLVESLERVAARVTREERLENKYLLHVALGALPYAFAKGYLSSEHALAERAFRLLFWAVDEELVHLRHVLPFYVRLGAEHTEFMKARVQQKGEKVWEEIEHLGAMLKEHPDKLYDVAPFLLELFDRSDQPLVRSAVLRGLAVPFEGKGLKQDPRTLLVRQDVGDVPLVDLILDRFVAAMAYRKDWDANNSATLAEGAWGGVGFLGDIRAIGPMLRYYHDAIRARRLNEDSWEQPEHNPIAQLMAEMPALTLARYLVFTPELHPFIARWRNRLFTPGRLEEIVNEVRAKAPDLEDAFRHLLDAPAAESKRESEPHQTSDEPVFFMEGIEYERDYYGILGIGDRKSDRKEVRAQYRKLSRLTHTDHLQRFSFGVMNEIALSVPETAIKYLRDDEKALLLAIRAGESVDSSEGERILLAIEAVFKIVSNAYSILEDSKRRASYDKLSWFGASRQKADTTDVWTPLWPLATGVVAGNLLGLEAALLVAKYALLGGLTAMLLRLTGRDVQARRFLSAA